MHNTQTMRRAYAPASPILMHSQLPTQRAASCLTDFPPSESHLWRAHHEPMVRSRQIWNPAANLKPCAHPFDGQAAPNHLYLALSSPSPMPTEPNDKAYPLPPKSVWQSAGASASGLVSPVNAGTRCSGVDDPDNLEGWEGPLLLLGFAGSFRGRGESRLCSAIGSEIILIR